MVLLREILGTLLDQLWWGHRLEILGTLLDQLW